MLTPSQETKLDSDRSRLSRDRRIMLFDLSVGGHHPGYIQHLIRYWGEQDLPGHLDVVVLPEFLEQHDDVVELARRYGTERVNFVPVTGGEAAALSSRSSYLRRRQRGLQEWDLLAKYATSLESTECLIMYFDTFQLSIALGRKIPCPFSGLYFRSRFHYSEFPQCQLTWKDQLNHWRERLHLSQVLRHPQLKTLFCLDQFVVEHFDQFHSKVKPVYLPDPIQIYNNSKLESQNLRESLGIDSARKVFLLFGALDARKGLHQLLEAIQLLPLELCQKLCLLLVGPISLKDKPLAESRIVEISQSLPVQIIVHDQFVVDKDIQPYFQISDVVLAPYQRHLGTSSILIRAAAEQKPVLSSDYGLMGEWTRRYELGLTVNSLVPSEIAKGLTRFLQESPEALCDHTKMESFAEQNSAERYADVIFQHL